MTLVIDPSKALAKKGNDAPDEPPDSSDSGRNGGDHHGDDRDDNTLPPANIYRTSASTNPKHYDVTVRLLNSDEVNQFRTGVDQRKLLLTQFIADINADAKEAILDIDKMDIEQTLADIVDRIIEHSQCYLVRWFGESQVAGLEVDGNKVGHGVRGTCYDVHQRISGGYQRLCSSSDVGSDGWNVAFMFFKQPADETSAAPAEDVPAPTFTEPEAPFIPQSAYRLYFGNDMRISAPYQPWHVEGLPDDAKVYIHNDSTTGASYDPITSDRKEHVRVSCRLGHAARDNSFTVERRGRDLVITASDESSTDVFLEIKYHDDELHLYFTPRPSI